MYHIVDSENYALYRYELDEYFRIRYEYFVGKRGWALAHANGMEKDRFDDRDTVYLLNILDSGRLIGGTRMIPTTKPHLMSEFTPKEVAALVPRGPEVWESSRGVCVEEYRNYKSVCEYCLAVAELSLLWGIERIVYLVDPEFFQTVLTMGWNARPIGMPFTSQNEIFVPGEIVMEPMTLRKMRQTTGFERPVIAYSRSHKKVA